MVFACDHRVMRGSIDSPANPEVKRLRNLHQVRGRRVQGSFLVEGWRVIDGFLDGGWEPRLLLVRADLAIPDGWPDDLVGWMSERVSARLSQARTPSGYLAEFAIPVTDHSATIDLSRGGLVLVEVADPGNLGTLIRSAAAFGMDQVAVLGGVDPFAAKAVQASAGAVAAVRLLRLGAVDDLTTLAANAPLVALVVEGGVGARDLPPGGKWLVIGNEAHGLGSAPLAACTHRLSLPMPGRVESLNAGVAGSIAAFLVTGGVDW